MLAQVLIAEADAFVAQWKDLQLPDGRDRRFSLPLHIRHYGLLASANRAANIAHARELLAMPSRPTEPETPEAEFDGPRMLPRPCPCCGGRMIIIETFARNCQPKRRPTPAPAAIRIDTS